MTRDEIYEHLAQVYLGKKNNKSDNKKKTSLSAWLVINIVITVLIFGSSFYAFSAFFTQRQDLLHNKVIYSLNHGPIRITYDLDYPHPPMKSFALNIPQVNAKKYKQLQFSVRGLEEGIPNIIRIELKNKKSEKASIFVEGLTFDWKQYNIPLSEFDRISDWTNVDEISFVLEGWNLDRKKGILLIDDVCFSN